MNLNYSDWKRAGFAAFCLLGIATLVIFAFRPGGFEGAAAWFYLFFPGAFPAAFLSDLVYKSSPRLEPVVYWTLVVSLSFVCYWGISFAVIKTLKLLRTLGFR
jgi:hypothetical protein